MIVVAIAKIEKVCSSIHGPLMGRADCILVKTGAAHRFLITEISHYFSQMIGAGRLTRHHDTQG
jgi:hypothetical protein